MNIGVKKRGKRFSRVQQAFQFLKGNRAYFHSIGKTLYKDSQKVCAQTRVDSGDLFQGGLRLDVLQLPLKTLHRLLFRRQPVSQVLGLAAGGGAQGQVGRNTLWPGSVFSSQKSSERSLSE